MIDQHSDTWTTLLRHFEERRVELHRSLSMVGTEQRDADTMRGELKAMEEIEGLTSPKVNVPRNSATDEGGY